MYRTPGAERLPGWPLELIQWYKKRLFIFRFSSNKTIQKLIANSTTILSCNYELLLLLNLKKRKEKRWNVKSKTPELHEKLADETIETYAKID